jgi:hypothetical protein
MTVLFLHNVKLIMLFLLIGSVIGLSRVGRPQRSAKPSFR